MDAIEVRPATGAEIAAIIALDRATPEAPHWPEREYRNRLAAAPDAWVSRCLLIASLAGELAGYAAARVVGGESELESVAVAVHARRRGVASALSRAAMEWCRNAGAKAIHLEVRESSTGAQRLYHSLGFKAVGRRASYYSTPPEDAVLMQAELAGPDRQR